MSDLRFIELVLLGKPRAWMRSGGMGKRRFEPKAQKTSKGVIQVYTLEALSKLGFAWPIDWLYRMRIDAFWPLAQGKYRKRHPRPMEPRGSTPDWDNLGKLVGDALEQILWANDRQIVDGRVLKWTANQGEPARTVVKVWAVRPGSNWRDVIGRD